MCTFQKVTSHKSVNIDHQKYKKNHTMTYNYRDIKIVS